MSPAIADRAAVEALQNAPVVSPRFRRTQLHACRDHPIGQTELGQHRHRVRWHEDARARRMQRRCGLVHVGIDAVTLQRDRGAQSTYSTTDDEHFGHTRLLGEWCSRSTSKVYTGQRSRPSAASLATDETVCAGIIIMEQ